MLGEYEFDCCSRCGQLWPCQCGPVRPGKVGNTMAKQSMAQQIQAAVAAALAGTATGGNLLHAAQSVPTFSFNGEWISFGLSEAPKNPKNAAPRICGLTGATIPAGAAIFYDRRTKSAALASAVVARYPQLFKG